MPAVLKGSADRVLTHGFAYTDEEVFDTGLLRGKRAMLSITTGGTEEELQADSCYTGTVEEFLKPFSGGVLRLFDSAIPWRKHGAVRAKRKNKRRCRRTTCPIQIARLTRVAGKSALRRCRADPENRQAASGGGSRSWLLRSAPLHADIQPDDRRDTRRFPTSVPVKGSNDAGDAPWHAMPIPIRS